MASAYKAYNAFLTRRPMLAQCTTAALLFGAGDVIAQQAIEPRGINYDPIRTLRLATYGGCFFGPPIAKWFDFLNRLHFRSPARGIVYKTFLDQTLMAPLAVGWFFGWMSVLEGKPTEISERVSTNYVPTVMRNWAVFIPSQIVNFSFVPPSYRFVFIGVVSLFWNTYLSAVNARQQPPVEVEKLEEAAIIAAIE
ncbi:hypothetical protein FISHEDRAFT_72053 [Fistulina hepatica ATCC 64428]|uniref:Protein SYM1 n=1 Tax=Fistulina hepatica ATCC 64428 TaxID=1128425 RepID=A0A0D7AI43_9AGAR|nr:hypothetical protein FISHEDRAFT_72053 [Fistulina hepatica ATCC 64428]